jgi:AmmeMemoRadiSam system protein A
MYDEGKPTCLSEGAKMIPEPLTPEERSLLLKLARQALERGVRREPLAPLDPQALTPHLRETGSSFVTLTRKGDLRGCIGALEAYQSLAEDVREHAVAAALQDFRFPPVVPDELPDIEIEISRLTPMQALEYTDPEELPKRIQINVDGVVLRDGIRRATFLPQVWEKIPDAALFLSHLCQKMGAPPDLWRRKKLDVWTYQVEEFHE